MLKQFIKNVSKNVLLMVGLVIVSALVGLLLISFTYSLPTNVIQSNIVSSAETLKNEPTYLDLYDWCTSRLDNFTDSIILANAAHNTDESNIMQASKIQRISIDDMNPHEAFVAHYAEGENVDSVVSYSRYWHGYLIVLKSLLLCADYSVIRIINFAVQFLLMCALACILYKKNKKAYIVPFVLVYCFLVPTVLGKSLQYSSCFYITILTCMVLILNESKLDKVGKYVFLFAGITVAYFDLLTYPLITFGIPAVLYFSMSDRGGIKQIFLQFIIIFSSWILGYIGMWSSKWLLGSVIIGDNIVIEGIQKVMYRTSSMISGDGIESVNVSPISAILVNIYAFLKTPVTIAFFIVLIILVICFLSKNKLTIFLQKKFVNLCFPYVLIASLPLLWYMFAINHSYIHRQYTSKILVMSVFAIVCMLLNLIKQNNNIKIE